MVEMVFVLLKQSFATVLACFWRFVLINLACKSNGRFSDTHETSINRSAKISEASQ
jgi:hypothetical protein